MSDLPILLTAENGAKFEDGFLTITQKVRRLAFVCEGTTACANVRAAMNLANVPFLHWTSTDGTERDTIEACRTAITIAPGSHATIPYPVGKGDYTIDWTPSEWSSLWYTAIHAAVFPVRRDGVLSLAVFVCTAQNQDAADKKEAVHFTCSLDDLRRARLHESQLGTHFVVPFDAAGVMPVCTPLQAHTLLCAYGRGSVCAVRLMPMVAASRDAIAAHGVEIHLQKGLGAACIYSNYARWALAIGSSAHSVREQSRASVKAADESVEQGEAREEAQKRWCIETIEGEAPPSEVLDPPAGPMDSALVEETEETKGAPLFRLVSKPHTHKDFAAELERMRDANRRRWRFCFGTVRYGAAERATAYLAAAIEAAAHCASGEERLGVLMSKACLAPYTDERDTALHREVRGTFEAASGKFLTERQSTLVRSMVGTETEKKRSAVQLNMGFGKSKVIVPMLVMLLLETHRCVIVTQPPHLVAEATRVICDAVAARPFVRAELVLVTGDTGRALVVAGYRRFVVVCSGTDLQGLLSNSLAGSLPREERVPLYTNQTSRAHIADEIDETSDPLTCERSETTGAPRAHYDPAVDTLTYHTAVCDLVAAENGSKVKPKENSAAWYVRLKRIAELTKGKKLNVNFGLVDTDGVYLAIPYKYAQTPSHGSRYSDLDVSAILTARAVYEACRKPKGPKGPTGLSASAQAALVRALTDAIGEREALRALERVNHEQLFRLHATLVALRQVVCFDTETVTSFVDVLGIADAFTAFSGTMAFDLPVPNVPHGDPRKQFMPPAVGGDVGERTDTVLLVTPDDRGNKLVELNIERAACETIGGAHTSDRVERVIAFLEGLCLPMPNSGEAKIPQRQMVIVDASGEFGVIAQPAFLAGARGFDEAGKLAPKRPSVVDVVYYDHQHSRGTDATIDSDAHGYVIVDWATSTLTEVAQAMYRLRGIDYGAQTITFVVCGAERKVTGSELYTQLKLNEELRAKRAHARSEIHRKRAVGYWEGTKLSAAWFSNKIEHPEIAEQGTEHREQKQTQTQEQEQQQSGSDRCIHITRTYGARAIDPLTLYDEREDRPMHASQLLESLRKTRVRVSPLLTFYNKEHAELERAFVVLTRHDGTTTVLLCTLVELWARSFSREGSQRSDYAAYTAHGFLVRATPKTTASEGDVLFGRFLCGDFLAHDEQVSLFEYMKSRYGDNTVQLQISKVLACLVSSRIMPAPTGLLHLLIDQPKSWASHDSAVPGPDVALVRELLAPAVRFGRARAFV